MDAFASLDVLLFGRHVHEVGVFSCFRFCHHGHSESAQPEEGNRHGLQKLPIFFHG